MNNQQALHELLVQIAETAYEASGFASQLALASRTKNLDAFICAPGRISPRGVAESIQHAVHARADNAPSIEQLKKFSGDHTSVDLELLSLHTSRFRDPARSRYTVSFIDAVENSLQSRILKAMNEWSESTGIQFVKTDGSGDMRVANERNGSWSYTGTDTELIPLHMPTTNLGGMTGKLDDNVVRRTVQHQTGHFLGFEHCPLPPDIASTAEREHVLQYVCRSLGWSRQYAVQRVFGSKIPANAGGNSNDSVLNSPSIMAWQFPVHFSKDRKKPLTGTDVITPRDKEFAASVYPSN